MRRLLTVLVVGMVLGGIALAWLGARMIETGPRVAPGAAPAYEDIARVKALLARFRDVTEHKVPETQITVTAAEMGSVVSMGRRTIPGARGEIRIAGERVIVNGSLPVQVMGRTLWVNASGVFPAFDNGIEPEFLEIGSLSIPPALALGALRTGVNLWMGDGAGDELIGAFPAMAVTGDSITVEVNLSETGRGGLAQKMFSIYRGTDMPSYAEAFVYYKAVRDAIDAGQLGEEGSFLPHLTFVLDMVRARAAEGQLAREYTAGVFGLTEACGSDHIVPYIRKLLPEGDAVPELSWTRDCGITGLYGREDLRRHFITAAAIRAASNRGVAISIGEFKELSDMRWSSGFDFTDIVADNAGVRLSDVLMGADGAEWDRRLALMQAEADIIPSIEGIPARLTRQQFETAYGSIDSPAYFAVIDEIEARIDRLAPYAGSGG